MSRGTKHRTVRIEDDLWDSAKTIADEHGESLSDVIRRTLEKYVADAVHSRA